MNLSILASQLSACRQHLDLRRHQAPLQPRYPLLIRSHLCGDVSPELARQLLQAEWADSMNTNELHLRGEPQALALWMRDQGLISRWRDEALDVRDLGSGAVVTQVERASFRPLGLLSTAVHLNATTPAGQLWLARRAAHKPTDPGLWDTLVGGLVAAGEPALLALERESFEEAGLLANEVHHAEFLASFRVQRPVPEGFQREQVEVYSLTLPADRTPCNQDGEVDLIEAVSPEQVLERILLDQLTLEAAWSCVLWLEARLSLANHAAGARA